MSIFCAAAFVLAVICLSLEADAQPTVDKTMTCRPSSSTSDEVVSMFKIIALNQKDNAKEIKQIKEIKDDIKDVKTLLESTPIDRDREAVEPSKQALVSAFERKYLHSFRKGGVPSPRRVGFGEGAMPLPGKLSKFIHENGKFWCIFICLKQRFKQ